MSLIDNVINNIKERLDNILSNKVNCILSPLKRFRSDFIGIEQEQYITLTANTKSGKSQFCNYMFLFHPIDFAYEHKDIISIHVQYFALEETPERIVQRYMSYLLFKMTNGKIRISPKELRSTNNKKPLDENIINLLQTKEYRDRLDFFEKCIDFHTDNSNPTGIYKICKDYAMTCGTVQTKEVQYGDKTYEIFDNYIPDDKFHYKMIIIDHIGLIDNERGFNLKESIDKLSEYFSKYLRNRYKYTIISIQQQNFENRSIQAKQSNKTEIDISGLGDSKYTARDSDIVLGLYSPFEYKIPSYQGYNITKFKDHIRFLNVLANRNGELGGICPMYFDGAVCIFKELPLPDDPNIRNYYNYLEKLN